MGHMFIEEFFLAFFPVQKLVVKKFRTHATTFGVGRSSLTGFYKHVTLQGHSINTVALGQCP